MSLGQGGEGGTYGKPIGRSGKRLRRPTKTSEERGGGGVSFNREENKRDTQKETDRRRDRERNRRIDRQMPRGPPLMN